MKILHLPLNIPGSEQVGQANGLRGAFSGAQIVEFDYLNTAKDDTNARLKSIARQGFSLGWFQLQETDWISPNVLKEIKPHFKFMVQWNGDIREVVPLYQQAIGKYFDITYLGFDHIRAYKPYCNKLKVMMIAVDPKEVIPQKQKKEYEVIFIGNHYPNRFPDSGFRLNLVNVLREKFKTLILGQGWPFGTETCPVKEQGKWYGKGKVCVSVNHFNNVRYFSERLLWCLASGTPTVAKRTPGLEFKEGEHYLGFDDIDECVRQIRHLFEYPELAQKLQKNARVKVLKNHTWENRFKEVKKDYELRHRDS